MRRSHAFTLSSLLILMTLPLTGSPETTPPSPETDEIALITPRGYGVRSYGYNPKGGYGDDLVGKYGHKNYQGYWNSEFGVEWLENHRKYQQRYRQALRAKTSGRPVKRAQTRGAPAPYLRSTPQRSYGETRIESENP